MEHKDITIGMRVQTGKGVGTVVNTEIYGPKNGWESGKPSGRYGVKLDIDCFKGLMKDGISYWWCNEMEEIK